VEETEPKIVTKEVEINVVTSESSFLKTFELIEVSREPSSNSKSTIVLPIWLLVALCLLLLFNILLSSTLIGAIIHKKKIFQSKEKALIDSIIEAQQNGIDLPDSLAKLTRNIKTAKVMPDDPTKSS
jgi:hypothetical protein